MKRDPFGARDISGRPARADRFEDFVVDKKLDVGEAGSAIRTRGRTLLFQMFPANW